MRKSAAVLMIPLAVVATACGGSTGSSTAPSRSTGAATPTSSTASTATSAPSGSVALSTKTLPGVGPVLVNGRGRTLYAFIPDDGKKVTCVGACASVWPPLSIGPGQKPAVSGGVNASLASSDPNPSGGRVVTYGGWPLYLYVSDPGPGTDHGQGVNSSGGLWYVIAPSGKLVKGKSAGGTSGAGSTTSSGGAAPYPSGGSGY